MILNKDQLKLICVGVEVAASFPSFGSCTRKVELPCSTFRCQISIYAALWLAKSARSYP